MIVNRWLDLHLEGDKYNQVGELVLKWDVLSEPKGKHAKFQHLWLGPFQVEEKIGQGTYRLKTLQGEIEKLPVNGQHLKRYFQYPPHGGYLLSRLGFILFLLLA